MSNFETARVTQRQLNKFYLWTAWRTIGYYHYWWRPYWTSLRSRYKKSRLHISFLKKSLVNSLYNYPANMTFFSTSEQLEIGSSFVSNNLKSQEALEYYRRIAVPQTSIFIYRNTFCKFIQTEDHYLLRQNYPRHGSPGHWLLRYSDPVDICREKSSPKCGTTIRTHFYAMQK